MSNAWIATGLSPMAASLKGSSILAIAARVRELVAGGREVCNLTIGDFDPQEYPIPAALMQGVIAAYEQGYTNYPPANGIAPLRQAIARLYKKRLGIDISPDDVTVSSGARPILFAAYRCLVGPGDKVVYATPSWNNNHYCQITDARATALAVDVETGFFPRLDAFAPHLRDARLFFINSPLNPSGTMIRGDVLAELCDSIVAENERRKAANEKPLFLIYDQIYWMLAFGELDHVDPIGVDRRMADYTIYVDGISKSFAATGLRLGWGVSPPPVCKAMNALLGHIGAWAPHPEQFATANLLQDDAAVDEYVNWIRREASDRLAIIYRRVEAIRAAGVPVRALEPQGAIYLSVEFNLLGYRHGDKVLSSTTDIGAFLLDAAGVAAVPFDAFGADHAGPWFRLSVGAVSRETLERAFDRIEAAIAGLQRP